ncbi:MAG: TusE/DsrC/DsvC family sulfur relay protein [Nitrospirota bacterium]
METLIGHHGKKLKLDEDGYLLNIDSWDINVVEYLARMEGIKELTNEHWKLITAIRLYYERTGMSPQCREILKETGLTKKDMYRLFPSGHLRGAYKLAGLPKPAGCN